MTNTKHLLLITSLVAVVIATLLGFVCVLTFKTSKTKNSSGLSFPYCAVSFDRVDPIGCIGFSPAFNLENKLKHLGVKSALERKKHNEVENSSAGAEALSSLHVALEMKSRGKLEKAQKLFWHALALHPSHPDVLNHYGEFIEEQENDVIQADQLYTKALVYRPGHSKALSNHQRTLPLVEEMDRNRLQRIDAKRYLLTKIPNTSSSLKRVKQEAYFQHVYHTVAIEGNTMSLSQTRHILETRMAVAGKSIFEHNEILGLDAALSFVNNTLVRRIGELKLEDILDIHKRVLGFNDPVEAGKFRRTQVWVGKHIPAHPLHMRNLMKDFLVWLNAEESQALHPIVFAALAHYKLAYIHPFIDGNGRTARLLMNLILMRAGFPAVIIPKGEKQLYFENLELADEGDIRPFIRFIADCTEKTLDVYLYATKEYPDELPELEGDKYDYQSPTIEE
uniref:Protein adenylyltransferase Fic n=1 Tax=Strigamia maritima TaxID=126957 RepID=T1JBA4_STRMM